MAAKKTKLGIIRFGRGVWSKIKVRQKVMNYYEGFKARMVETVEPHMKGKRSRQTPFNAKAFVGNLF